MGWRGVGVALLVVGACSSEGEVAGVDAASGTDATCQPIAEPRGAELEISWSCVLGCDSDPPFRYFDRLEIDAERELRYLRDECEICAPVLDDYIVSGDCLAATGIPLGDGRRSEPYEICRAQCGATAPVAFSGRPGPPEQSVWRMTLALP